MDFNAWYTLNAFAGLNYSHFDGENYDFVSVYLYDFFAFRRF